MSNAIELARMRHLLEQLAYEEIRHFLSNKFIEEPVVFMYEHGKRPEDMTGADLRAFYKEALARGIEVRQSTPEAFRRKFNEGRMFGEGGARYNVG